MCVKKPQPGSLENNSPVIPDSDGPGILRQCLHCGKFFALKRAKDVSTCEGSVVRVFTCRKCGQTERYLVQRSDTSKRTQSGTLKDENYRL